MFYGWLNSNTNYLSFYGWLVLKTNHLPILSLVLKTDLPILSQLTGAKIQLPIYLSFIYPSSGFLWVAAFSEPPFCRLVVDVTMKFPKFSRPCPKMPFFQNFPRPQGGTSVLSKHVQILKDCMNPVIPEVPQCCQTRINKKWNNYSRIIKGENPEVTLTAY